MEDKIKILENKLEQNIKFVEDSFKIIKKHISSLIEELKEARENSKSNPNSSTNDDHDD